MHAAGRCRSAAAAVLAGGAACGDTSATGAEPAGRPRITLIEAQHAGGSTTVDVAGLPPADLAAVRSASLTAEEWEALLRVTVAAGSTAASDRPAVLGDYRVADGALRYLFDPGRQSRVVFTPGRLPASGAGGSEPWRLGPLTATVGGPAVEGAPATRVAGA